MRAIGIRAYGGRDRLQLLEIEEPQPGPGEIVLGIRAAGVNPIDWKVREGLRRERLPHVLPLVLGWEAAGVVEAVGAGVGHLTSGDAVYTYCRPEVVHRGAYSERLALPASLVAPMPRALDFVHAAALPLAGTTAWQALDALGLEEGETLLVLAAAGGVGSLAVQLARAGGARVLGTASPGRHAWLHELGCDTAFDYRTGGVAEAIRRVLPEGVDAILDAAGPSAVADALDALRSGGRIVSLVEAPDDPRIVARDLHATWFFAAPAREILVGLGHLVDEGRLGVHVEATFPLEDAAAAHERLETGHVRGKLVLEV